MRLVFTPQFTPSRRPKHNTTPTAAAALAEEGRQWLKQAQAWVLHVESQAAALAAAAGAAGEGAAAAWSFLLPEAARCLARVARQMAAGGASPGEALAYGAVPPRAGAGGRRLAPVAAMPYYGHWARAVAI